MGQSLAALRRVAVLAHASDPWSPHFIGELERAAAKLGLQLRPKHAIDAGGLFALGPDQNEISRTTARYVKRILDGVPPGRLPVQQPSRFVLVLNAGTARALGLELPSALRLRADEVIE